MFSREKKASCLYYSPYISFFKMKPNHTRVERLIENVFKSFDDLNSIFFLLNNNKVSRILDICYEWTSRIVRQLFPGELLLELLYKSLLSRRRVA